MTAPLEPAGAPAEPATAGTVGEPPPAGVGWTQRLVMASGTVTFTMLAIVTALAVGALVIIFSDPDTLDEWGSFFSDPGGALSASWDTVFEAYRALLDSSMGSSDALSRTLLEAIPLSFAGLSVALAFRAGLFNIGVAGQLVMGATAAGYVGFHYDLPTIVHLPLALAAGMGAGMAWAGIAGYLKARTGVHEVIATIMLNNIAIRLLDWFLSLDRFHRPGRNDPLSPPVAESARLPELPGPLDVTAGVVLGVLAAVGVWWLLGRSTVGFRMRAVGANPEASRAAGMNVPNTYLLSMALAGGLAGLAGTMNILGRSSYSLSGGYFSQTGFDAIALALVGRARPGGVVGAAVLFGALQAGSTGMQAVTQTPVDIIIVIQALIIAFVSAPAIVQAIWRFRAGRGVGQQTFTAGWGAA